MERNTTEPMLSRYLHARAAQRGLPLAGTFELTARCNFNCKMCYVHLGAQEAAQRGRELNADEWLSIAEEARQKGMLFLLLTGGEPLLRPDFPYLLRELKKMGLVVSVNSNASLINEEMLQFLKSEPPFRFNISLYGGCSEAYQTLCGVPAFETVLGNIKKLREIGIDVKLNASMTPYNETELERIYEIAEQLHTPIQVATYMFPPLRRDAEQIGKNDRFTPEAAAACAVRWDRLRFTPEQFAKRAEAMRKGLSCPEEEVCDGSPGEGISCRAGRSSFWINWRGDMTPCGMMPHPAASVLEKGFEKAWEETKQAAFGIRLPPECSSCRLKPSCRACAAMCLTETGSFDCKPDYICKMTHETARLTLEKDEER